MPINLDILVKIDHDFDVAKTEVLPALETKLGFVAINTIHCQEHYIERFEALFASRAHAIDRMPGFHHMEVLKPAKPGDAYLIVSHWESEEAFKDWTNSPEFIEGHRRGFEDIRAARERGEEPPMTSDFRTYSVLCR